MYIAAYYRPHISDDYSLIQLDLSLQKLKETVKNATIILTGEFNLPGIDWLESLVKHDSSYKAIHEHSLDILHDHSLQQLVTFPTRQVNMLDLVATNKPSTIINIQSSAGESDHDMVLFEVRSQVKMIEQPSRTIYMYDRVNWDALREELHVALTTDHVDTLEGTDVEQLWSKFKSSLRRL